MIGVTGANRASCLKVGRIPPSRPKTKLGRKITCSSPEPATVGSISHFASPACGVGDVALEHLTAPGGERPCRRRGRLPHQAADRPVLLAKRMHDLGTHEAGSARNQNHDSILGPYSYTFCEEGLRYGQVG